MSCYHPRKGYLVTRASDGKKRLKFTRPKPPLYGDTYKSQTVQCGVCIGCRLNYSKQWAIRCTHEAKMHDDNCYLTLTYNNANLPKNNTLVKSHFQKFMRRMRKHPDIPKIRFFMCGEYGKATEENHWIARPHYHAIIFGYNPTDLRAHQKNKQGDMLYTSETISKIWGKGFVTIGEVNFKSTAYVARYITKKIVGDDADQHYRALDEDTGELISIQQEFTNQSRKPGIGQTWYEAYGSDVFPSDEVIIDARPMKPPRYYDKQLEKSSPAMHELVKAQRKLGQKLMESMNPEENTPYRLETKERVANYKLRLNSKRDL